MSWLEILVHRKREKVKTLETLKDVEFERRRLETLARGATQSTEDSRKAEEIRLRLTRQLASYNPEQLLEEMRRAWGGVGSIVAEQYIDSKGEDSLAQVSLIYEYPAKGGDYSATSGYSGGTGGGGDSTHYVSAYKKDGGDAVIIGVSSKFGYEAMELSVKSGNLYRTTYPSSFADNGVSMIHASEECNFEEDWSGPGMPVLVTEPGEKLDKIQEYLSNSLIYREDHQKLPLQNQDRSRIETRGLKRL